MLDRLVREVKALNPVFLNKHIKGNNYCIGVNNKGVCTRAEKKVRTFRSFVYIMNLQKLFYLRTFVPHPLQLVYSIIMCFAYLI